MSLGSGSDAVKHTYFGVEIEHLNPETGEMETLVLPTDSFHVRVYQRNDDEKVESCSLSGGHTVPDAGFGDANEVIVTTYFRPLHELPGGWDVQYPDESMWCDSFAPAHEGGSEQEDDE